MPEFTCTATPVSWLRLERLALGELAGEEARAIDAHLSECAFCRARAAECLPAVELLPLNLSAAPRLSALGAAADKGPLAVDPRPLASVVRHPRFPQRSRWVLPVALGLAAAAAIVLMVRPDATDTPTRGIARLVPSERPHDAVGVMDADAYRSEPTLTILRERGGTVVEDAPTFLVSDRFAVQLSCRPGEERQQRVAVYQSGAWSLPLTDEGARCGNRVRVPGAFRLTEASPADICLLWGETALKASTASDQLPAPEGLREATCQRVEPVRAPTLP